MKDKEPKTWDERRRMKEEQKIMKERRAKN